MVCERVVKLWRTHGVVAGLFDATTVFIGFSGFGSKKDRQMNGEGVAFGAYNDAYALPTRFLDLLEEGDQSQEKTPGCRMTSTKTPNRISKSIETLQKELLQRLLDQEANESHREGEIRATSETKGMMAPPSPEPALLDLTTRLKQKFGLGSNREMRKRFYDRLTREVEKFGTPVLEIIRHCSAESSHAKYPDRWFCKAVRIRLIEAGYLKSEMRSDI